MCAKEAEDSHPASDTEDKKLKKALDPHGTSWDMLILSKEDVK